MIDKFIRWATRRNLMIAAKTVIQAQLWLKQLGYGEAAKQLDAPLQDIFYKHNAL